jgi:hypothetical protein
MGWLERIAAVSCGYEIFRKWKLWPELFGQQGIPPNVSGPGAFGEDVPGPASTIFRKKVWPAMSRHFRRRDGVSVAVSPRNRHTSTFPPALAKNC